MTTLVNLAIIAGGVVVVLGLLFELLKHVIRWELRDNNNQTSEVLNEVKNTHKENLRDDLDKKFQGLHAEVAEMRGEITVLTGLVQQVIGKRKK